MNPVWLAHGGRETIESYINSGLLASFLHKNFFRALQNYYIDDQNRLFLRAGFTSMHGVGKEEYEPNYYWDRTLWEAALLAEKIDPNDLKGTLDTPKCFLHYNEIIYIGHTPTTNYNKNTPMKAIIFGM